MPEPLQHGIKIVEGIGGRRTIMPAASGIIGIIATAVAAAGKEADLNAAFPLDTPVLLTNIRKGIGLAGVDGTLKPALEAIADQTSPIVVVIRVAVAVAGAENPTQDELVIGDTVEGVYTGLKALLAAESQLGVRPRVIGAPGLDTTPVINALVPVAQKLRAHVYAQADGDTVVEATTAAGTFGQRELTLIWPRFAHAFLGDTVARALGLRARIDEEIGWHKTLSNIVVNGVTGLDKDVFWDLNDDDSDAAVLNGAKIVTLINRDGYRFWGNRTLSADPLFAFESAVRTNNILKDEIVAGLFWAIDMPLTRTLVKDIIETINARFRRLVATGRLIGAKAWFDPDLNPPEQLAAGKLVVDYDFTPVAPAEVIELNSQITDRYYVSFADLVA